MDKCPRCDQRLSTPNEPCPYCKSFFTSLEGMLETAEGRKAVRERLAEYDKRVYPKEPAVRTEIHDHTVGEDFLARLGEEYRRERRDRDLTQVEVGRRLGVTHYQLGRWEKGTQLPNLPMFLAWANVLGTKLSELLTRLGE